MDTLSPVEFLKSFDNTRLVHCIQTPLSVAGLNNLLEEHNGAGDFISKSDWPRAVEAATYNERLIRDGIGLTYENGWLVMYHGSQRKAYRGSSVEGWGSGLTDSDREYARSFFEK